MIRKFVIFIVALVIIFIDQYSKHVFEPMLMNIQSMQIIENVLSFLLVYNEGVAFGLLSDNTFLTIIFSVVVSVAITIYLLFRKSYITAFEIIAWGFVLGGAIGNLIDRLSLGYVIDFIKLEFIDFPVFNFADLFINIGIFMLFILIFIEGSTKSKE